LDQPGEWYLNRQSGVLKYWARAGEDLTKAEVIAPRLHNLMLARGDFESKMPIHHLILRDLTFSDTDWQLGPNGYADSQAAIATHGDVLAEGATDCAIENCVFTRLAGYALELGRGCQRWRVIGNEMFDLGSGGIRIGEVTKRQEAFEQNSSHIITDSHIHDAGLVYAPAVGI